MSQEKRFSDTMFLGQSIKRQKTSLLWCHCTKCHSDKMLKKQKVLGQNMILINCHRMERQKGIRQNVILTKFTSPMWQKSLWQNDIYKTKCHKTNVTGQNITQTKYNNKEKCISVMKHCIYCDRNLPVQAYYSKINCQT